MRVALGGISHETNTYADESSGPTGLDAFTVARGERVLRARGTNTVLGGAVDALEAAGADVVGCLFAQAWPSGTIRGEVHRALRDELLDAVRAALPVDAVLLELHGAAVAEGVDDVEGDLGRALREVVGPDVPIVAGFDLHGNVTDEMAEVFDGGLYACHLYPHTDLAERGRELVALLPRLLAGERPVTHVEHLPMLLPTSTTDPGNPADEVNERCRQVEARSGVVDCTVFHGFPYVDVPAVGVHVSCTAATLDDARAGAREVARWIWANREAFRSEHDDPAGAVRTALRLAAEGRTPVVVNETNDNPGGGAPGDATHLLRAMLEADVRDACFAIVHDPEVAATAHAAGVGATITVHLGGKHDRLHGDPIELTARVKALTDGRFTLQRMLAGVRMDLGPSCRLVVGGRDGSFDIVVASKPWQTMDDEVFLLHGIDVRRKAVVGLKSSQHFRAGFRDLAAAIVTSDAPGLTTLRTEVFERTRAAGPMWPRDPEASWS